MTLFTLIFLVIGCTSPDMTVSTLQKAGYTDIIPGKYAFYGCSEEDMYSTKFIATNPAGNRVSGVVCCGILKSCTIRF